jgi:leucyl/phenylalanyl-tRNA--protein transferase
MIFIGLNVSSKLRSDQSMAGLTPQLLLGAYASGIFPMAESRHDPDLYWIDPDSRGIIPLDAFHVPRRLRKTLRTNPFEIRCNSDFLSTVRGCAEPQNDRPETWINDEIERLYEALFEMGFAHSVECWNDGELIGGLYGVSLGGAFFGESMFSRARDASKIALCHLAARLRKSGYVLLDSQFATDHLRQFGTVEIDRADYKQRLAEALKVNADFQPELSGAELDAFIQSTTQTS